MTNSEIKKYLAEFKFKDSDSGGRKTLINFFDYRGIKIPKFINEFWTSRQRQSNRIHEISYRACYKAELPNFFICLLTKEKDIVYDPFSGRGTTVIEAALLNRKIIANDINPLSKIISKPRLNIPTLNEIENRLNKVKFKSRLKADIDLSMFYHPDTESEIVSLRNYLIRKKKNQDEDYIDNWIRMVATNRLTGHSKNFFSVYTLPPNQAITRERQRKINAARNQIPSYKNVKQIILKKSRDLTSELNNQLITQLKHIDLSAKYFNEDARYNFRIKKNSVHLTITSPPFLNLINYVEDNWLRCWFNNINADEVAKKIILTNNVTEWSQKMGEVLVDLFRITKKKGFVAYEVGDVRKGKINLDELIIPQGINAGFECLCVIINQQKFTKTANIWGVKNNSSGTNTNRIVLFRKP